MIELILSWCSYCRSNQPREGFKDVFETSRGYKRRCNSKCAKCSKLKRLTKAQRDERGARLRKDQKAEAARKLAEIIRRRSDPTA